MINSNRPGTPFSSSRQHILAELTIVNWLIAAAIKQESTEQVAESSQGVYISKAEVETLLTQPLNYPWWVNAPPLLAQPEIVNSLENLTEVLLLQREASHEQGVVLRLDALVIRFSLSPIDRAALLIALAPDLDLRFERLYAYLQDDITRQRPCVDLILTLICPSTEEKLIQRQRFTAQAPLRYHNLLQFVTNKGQGDIPLLSQSVRVDERIVDFLLDGDIIDERLASFVTVFEPDIQFDALFYPDTFKQRLELLAQQQVTRETATLLYLVGESGVGKQATACAFCNELGLKLLVVDSSALLQLPLADFSRSVRLIERESWLQHALVFWRDFDSLLSDEQQLQRDTVLTTLTRHPRLTFLTGTTAWETDEQYAQINFTRIDFPRPNHAERVQLWVQSLNGHNDAALATALAHRFRLNGGQIKAAATTAANLAHWRDPDDHVTDADLVTACRLHSNRKLATLAQQIKPHYTWDDIVLPADRLDQLREIQDSVVFRAQVYETWGFDRKLAMGKGINALFAGPSGTGKTMAADILAHELGLDLYKIDLSTVVSKYIGETEKNLARIFAEAETSNAILFFDEADALFGKRSEVRDAHDRYANIEISYLLQKMEEYDGVVILATNLRQNMDDAFVRRMHFTVEFPFPTENYRRHIWYKIWPEETPRSADLDLTFMARRFEISGGNIRNVALAAAFLAAADGGTVNMTHLIRAMKRELQKMGKVILDEEFGIYAHLTVNDQYRR
ncbi:MAG: ATP-binding protein [Anaerolineae bacterium]|nr:ATP-binding protein [Anaerolineae bacterium]